MILTAIQYAIGRDPLRDSMLVLMLRGTGYAALLWYHSVRSTPVHCIYLQEWRKLSASNPSRLRLNHPSRHGEGTPRDEGSSRNAAVYRQVFIFDSPR
jgi:hypothetical protein